MHAQVPLIASPNPPAWERPDASDRSPPDRSGGPARDAAGETERAETFREEVENRRTAAETEDREDATRDETTPVPVAAPEPGPVRLMPSPAVLFPAIAETPAPLAETPAATVPPGILPVVRGPAGTPVVGRLSVAPTPVGPGDATVAPRPAVQDPNLHVPDAPLPVLAPAPTVKAPGRDAPDPQPLLAPTEAVAPVHGGVLGEGVALLHPGEPARGEPGRTVPAAPFDAGIRSPSAGPHGRSPAVVTDGVGEGASPPSREAVEVARREPAAGDVPISSTVTAPEPESVPEQPAPKSTPAEAAGAKAPAVEPVPPEIESSIHRQVGRAVLQQTAGGERVLHLRLTPPELGTVTIEMLEQRGELTLRLHAEDDQVRLAIDRQLPQIRQDLRLAEHPVRDVELDNRNLPSFQQQGEAEQGPWQQADRRPAAADAAAPFSLAGEAPAENTDRQEPALGGLVSNDRVDYRV